MNIKRVANLARIKINEKEEEKLKKDLSSILVYIEKLNEVNTEKIEPLYQTTGLIDAFRSDESRKEFDMNKSLDEKLIGQAPHKENRFIKVKPVLLHK